MKPQPKELVIQCPSNGILWIYAHSDDAKEWIERECPTYGSFMVPNQYTNHYTLFVTPTSNFEEVFSCLNSYNEEK